MTRLYPQTQARPVDLVGVEIKIINVKTKGFLLRKKAKKKLQSKTMVALVLNYSRSCNPTRIRAHMQRHIQASREPLNLGVCMRVCALSQDRT
jgi:hypothetical protein